MRLAGIYRQPAQPGAHAGALRPVGGQGHVYAKEHVLGHVLGVLRVSQESAHQFVNVIAVDVEHEVERISLRGFKPYRHRASGHVLTSRNRMITLVFT